MPVLHELRQEFCLDLALKSWPIIAALTKTISISDIRAIIHSEKTEKIIQRCKTFSILILNFRGFSLSYVSNIYIISSLKLTGFILFYMNSALNILNWTANFIFFFWSVASIPKATSLCSSLFLVTKWLVK